MRRRANLWHDAICEQLRAAGAALTVGQIWERLVTAGFQHASENPRQTLGGRIAELVSMKWVERAGPATYRLLPGGHAQVSP